MRNCDTHQTMGSPCSLAILSTKSAGTAGDLAGTHYTVLATAEILGKLVS